MRHICEVSGPQDVFSGDLLPQLYQPQRGSDFSDPLSQMQKLSNRKELRTLNYLAEGRGKEHSSELFLIL